MQFLFQRHILIKFYYKKFDLHLVMFRPFLYVSRKQMLQFCEFWNLPVYPDRTNFNLSLKRNRLRLQSLPYLKFFFNLNLFNTISLFQIILKYENQYFDFIHQKFCKTRNFSFLKIPKIFQYRFLYFFFYFMNKKISLNEISSTLEKIEEF